MTAMTDGIERDLWLVKVLVSTNVILTIAVLFCLG